MDPVMDLLRGLTFSFLVASLTTVTPLPTNCDLKDSSRMPSVILSPRISQSWFKSSSSSYGKPPSEVDLFISWITATHSLFRSLSPSPVAWVVTGAHSMLLVVYPVCVSTSLLNLESS